jgi:hypothetical protein
MTTGGKDIPVLIKTSKDRLPRNVREPMIIPIGIPNVDAIITAVRETRNERNVMAKTSRSSVIIKINAWIKDSESSLVIRFLLQSTTTI